MVLETVHTKVNTADIGTKYLDALTMRRLVGLLGVRLLTLDGAEAVRCDDERRVQVDGWIVFLWIASVAAAVVLVTMWSKRKAVCVAHVETQTESVDVSGVGEKFHVSKSCNGLRYAVRVYRKAACECFVKVYCAGNGR